MNNVKQFIDEVERLREEIKIAECRINELKLSFNELPNIAINKLNEDQREFLAHYFYWHVIEMNADTIAPLVGAKNGRQLPDLILDSGVSLNCKVCGQQYLITAKSRTHLQGILSNIKKQEKYIKSGKKLLYWHSILICQSCKDTHEQKSRIARKEHNLKIEARLIELKTMPYREYLQTPEWKATRKQKLKRANYKCQLCNAGGVLNVHHRTYERRGNEDDNDLIVLCQPCHEIFHSESKLSK